MNHLSFAMENLQLYLWGNTVLQNYTRLGGLHADSILNHIVHNIIIIKSGSIKMRELLDSKSINIKFKDAFS